MQELKVRERMFRPGPAPLPARIFAEPLHLFSEGLLVAHEPLEVRLPVFVDHVRRKGIQPGIPGGRGIQVAEVRVDDRHVRDVEGAVCVRLEQRPAVPRQGFLEVRLAPVVHPDVVQGPGVVRVEPEDRLVRRDRLLPVPGEVAVIRALDQVALVLRQPVAVTISCLERLYPALPFSPDVSEVGGESPPRESEGRVDFDGFLEQPDRRLQVLVTVRGVPGLRVFPECGERRGGHVRERGRLPERGVRLADPLAEL